MRIKIVVLLSLFGSSKYVLSMAPEEAAAVQQGEDTAPKVASCGRPACNNLAKQRCSKCKTMKYCSRECQGAHWRDHKLDCAQNQAQLVPMIKKSEYSEFILSCIGRCKEDTTLATTGYLKGMPKEKEINILEVLQVALKNKPIAFFSWADAPEKMTADMQEAVKFAESSGANVTDYQDAHGGRVTIVFRPGFKKAADHFINRQRNPMETVLNLDCLILEGVVLGYTRENIESFAKDFLRAAPEQNVVFIQKMKLEEKYSQEEFQAAFLKMYTATLFAIELGYGNLQMD